MREYRGADSNRATIAAQKAAWYKEHRTRLLEKARLRREAVHFANRREAVLARDGFKCTKCGSRKRLVVHHKDGLGRGSAAPHNSDDNLVTLCRRCHIDEHRDQLHAARGVAGHAEGKRKI